MGLLGILLYMGIQLKSEQKADCWSDSWSGLIGLNPGGIDTELITRRNMLNTTRNHNLNHSHLSKCKREGTQLNQRLMATSPLPPRSLTLKPTPNLKQKFTEETLITTNPKVDRAEGGRSGNDPTGSYLGLLSSRIKLLILRPLGISVRSLRPRLSADSGANMG
jgi:hypothetical protein